jgi:hypothetical protein
MRKSINIKQTSCVLSFIFIFIPNHAFAQQQQKSVLGPPVFEHLGNNDFKVTHGPYLQQVTEDGATLVWTTNKKAIAWVEIAPKDDTNFYEKKRPKYYAAKIGLKQIATLHKVYIRGLKPGTRYRYRIFSKQILSHKGYHTTYGDVVATKVFGHRPPSFKTNDPSKKSVSFLMVNDIHERPKVLKTLLINGGYKDADMILFDGDMVNSLRSKKQMFDSFMDMAVHLFAGEIPMYYTRGNHETRGAFASSFPRFFPSPSPMGKLYYLIREGPVCFIILDSGEDKPDTDIEYSGVANFDHYRKQEALWLRKVVQRKKFKDAPFKIAVLHIPPFGGWHGEEMVNKLFVPALNKADIDIMLCAHLHRYVYKSPQDGDWDFPIIVNGKNTVLQVKTDGQKININMIGRKDKITHSFVLKTNHTIINKLSTKE